MKGKFSYIFIILIFLSTFFLLQNNIKAEYSGTGGTGSGSVGTSVGDGDWYPTFGFYIKVYNKNDGERSTISVDDSISGWISKTNNDWISNPDKLYAYLNIPYGSVSGNYSTLLSKINVTLNVGDYITIEPYTKIGDTKYTFREISDSTEKYSKCTEYKCDKYKNTTCKTYSTICKRQDCKTYKCKTYKCTQKFLGICVKRSKTECEKRSKTECETYKCAEYNCSVYNKTCETYSTTECEKTTTYSYPVWYAKPAVILSNAAKVGTTITAGSKTFTAPSSSCTTTSYGSSNYCGYSSNKNIGYGITVVRYEDIYPDYTVTYKANGGEGAPGPQTKQHGVDLTLSSTQPTRTGYTFINWNTKKNGTGTSYNSGGTYKSNKDVTLYAQWKLNEYTVTYKANGGEGAPASQTKQHGVDLTLSSTKPTRRGYTFVNWNTEASGTGTNYNSGGKYTSNSNVTLYAQWDLNPVTLKIEKVKSNHTPISSKDVQFQIFTTSDCSGAPVQTETITTNSRGIGTISILPLQHYYMKESVAPAGYVTTGECIYLGYFKEAEDKGPIEVINKTQCEIDFEANSSISNRLYLYTKYGFRNLLNFKDKTTASEACSAYEPNYDPQNTCLSTDQVNNTTENKFTDQNLSDYNDTIAANSGPGQSYCLTDFELTKEVTYNSSTKVKAGRMIFSIGQDDAVAEGTLTKTCYIHKDVYSSYSITDDNFINTNDYLGQITLDDKKLEFVATKSVSSNHPLIGEFYEVVGTATIKFKPNAVYVQKISGDVCEETDKGTDKCRLIGYGVASKFKDAKQSSPYFNFSISAPSNSIFNFESGSDCKYQVEPEIIKYNKKEQGNLEIEFRTIDTTKPFNRNTKSNWSNGADNTKNNQTVKDNIINKNNSYNKTGNGSLYTNQTDGTKRIILTPDIVKKIRDYNAGTGDCYSESASYNDYEIYIKEEPDGTKTKTSKFFECIGIIKLQ